MISFGYLTMLACASPSIQPAAVLTQLESCYDAMQPAVEKSKEAFIWLSDIPHPIFNAVMHLSCENVQARVDAIIEQTPTKNPLSFWVHPENKAEGLAEILQARGFKPMITCHLMACPIKATQGTDYSIRPVDADSEIFYQIISDVYHLDNIVLERFAAFMKTIQVENYLVYLGDKPVGTGTLLPHGQIGAIFNDATLPEYEKKGCEEAMMKLLMTRAEQLHLKQLVFLGSPGTEKLYEKLGFRTLFDIDIYAR